MTQGRLFALMSELYGDVPLERFKKLKEEFLEALADFSENVVPFRYGKIK